MNSILTGRANDLLASLYNCNKHKTVLDLTLLLFYTLHYYYSVTTMNTLHMSETYWMNMKEPVWQRWNKAQKR